MKKTFGFIVFIILISSFGCGTKDQKSSNLSEIKIGDQVWMTENLNVEHYRNGDIIPEVQDKYQWESLRTGAWCYYENDPANGKKYGKLYNWYAVNDPRGLAPEGWHIPTEAEFQTLYNTVGGDGNALKEIGEGEGEGAGTNTSGFSALLAGYRYYDGFFINLGYGTYFWSSTEIGADYAFNLYLGYYDSNIYLYGNYKGNGVSVRCVKD